VPEHPQILERWSVASEFARAHGSRRIDVAYGSTPAETLDVFPTPRANAPVLVFIHGGWWRTLDKSDQSFIAPVFNQAGALVVIPNYGLCPAVTIETIALQLTRALVWTYRNAALYGGDPQRIVVAGHSAGGHLAAMMLSCDWRAIDAKLPARLVRGALSISGVFDLEPIRHAPFLKGDLRLTPASAQRLSPVRFPRPSGPLYATVGALESDLRDARARATAAEQRAIDAQQAVAGTRITVAVLTAPDVARIDLAGQAPAAPGAAARAFWSRSRGMVFTASNLPALPPGRVYQLWVVTAQPAPISAGLLTPDAQGSVNETFNTPSDIPQPVALAVTIEPAGGVRSPTGERYLVGTVVGRPA